MARLHLASRFALACLVLGALALSGCLFGGDGDKEKPMTAASLEETGLIGLFDLIDFKVEYTDGNTIDTSKAKLSGIIQVTPDSAYVQRIWISLNPVDTRGRITSIVAEQGNRKKGKVILTLEGSTVSGETAFELRGDSLSWITEVEPGAGGGKVGFTETGRYVRNRD